MTKLLIVDDSALMRKYLREIFEADGSFTVATARNGRDALEQIATFDPGVVTLDVNMPEMDGITCLAAIMTDTPRPVVMVSSITTKGAEVTLEALKLGAVDYVEKPGGTVSLNIDQIRDRLVATVKAAARAKPRRSRGLVDRVRNAARSVPEPRVAARGEAPGGLVLIGVSTGGPRTIEDILPELPQNFRFPIIVAQHMPAAFTASFAARLNSICRIQVQEVTGPMQMKPGNAYIGRGNADVVVETRLGRQVVNVASEDPAHLWHPSVERLVRSAMRNLDPRTLIAVQLTGMGNDGAAAMTDLRQAGGHTIAEHESTAIVYGMPAELVKLGGAEKILPSDRIADQLISWSK